jgi:hypothetical protein
LTVSSEPLGATVYVDGEAQGATPLEVTKLSPGDHRVRVEKDGYLENSRLVSVASGQSRAVQVKLTPDSGARFTTTTQVEKKGGGGGGSKKGLWIALGVVAVGAGVALALAGGNEAPTVSATTATPTTGLAAATSIQFSTTASDPDGDALTYSWNFGDGGSGSGANPTHVYPSAGTFNVSVTVSDGEKSATGSTSVTIRSLSGAWGGTLDNTVSTTCNFSQNAASISGNCGFVGLTGTVSGAVSAPLVVRFTVTIPGFTPFTFNGNADTEVNRLTGSVTGSGFTGESWTMTRR